MARPGLHLSHPEASCVHGTAGGNQRRARSSQPEGSHSVFRSYQLVSVGLCAGLVGVAACGADPEPTPPLEAAWFGDFTPGPHPVGFRTEAMTRNAPEGERSLTLSVWYPAEAEDSAQRLTIADYFRAVVAEGQLTETDGLAEESGFAAAMTGSSSALTVERARAGLDTPVLATREAGPAPGPFPVVLWSSRHATVLAQAPIAEMLASQGFVVATVWSSDPPLAFLWEDRTSEDKLATIEAHTGDLQHALERLREDPAVDGDNVITVSWSYGGQTAARLQERDPGVRGVIAMDANVLPAREEESLTLRTPLVYLVGENTSGRGFDRLQSLDQPWLAIRFSELAHGSFNALEGYLPAALDTDTVFVWAQGGETARVGYQALTRVVGEAALELTSQAATTAQQLSARLEPAAQGTSVELFSNTVESPR